MKIFQWPQRQYESISKQKYLWNLHLKNPNKKIIKIKAVKQSGRNVCACQVLLATEWKSE